MGTKDTPSRQQLTWLYKDLHSVVGEMMHVSSKARELKQHSLAAKISSRAYEIQGYANVLLDGRAPQLVVENAAEGEEPTDSQQELPF